MPVHFHRLPLKVSSNLTEFLFFRVSKTSVARLFQFAVESFAQIRPQHRARSQNQPSRPAQQWIDGKISVRRGSADCLRAIPVSGGGLAIAVPSLAGDRVSIQPALIPQIQRLEFAAARTGDSDGACRYFAVRPGMRSQRDDRPVHFADATAVLEVLIEGAAPKLHRGPIRSPEPHPSSAEPKRDLLAGKVFHVFELVLVKVALSIRNQELVAQAEAEGTHRLGGR